MTVYAVKWNNIHTRIFLSASADWTLKLWEGDNQRPVMSFDLTNPVGDAAWSPHSATIFAAVTDDGKVGTPAPSYLVVCKRLCFILTRCYLCSPLQKKGSVEVKWYACECSR